MKTQRANIIDVTRHLFSRGGYDGFTMRTLARESGLSLSSIYHYYEDKNVLLKAVFDETSTQLGKKRATLPKCDSATEELKQRIKFQFDNAEDILFVLRYYLHFRSEFPKLERGFLNDKAYLHIKEVLERGVASHEFTLSQSVDDEAKVIAHSINGFVLEYFPESPSEDEYSRVVDSIHTFLVRSLTNKAVTV